MPSRGEVGDLQVDLLQIGLEASGGKGVGKVELPGVYGGLVQFQIGRLFLGLLFRFGARLLGGVADSFEVPGTSLVPGDEKLHAVQLQ